MADRRLVVMARTPEPGRVKTRATLGTGALTPLQAAALQEACCRDALGRPVPAGTAREVHVHGPLDHPLWREAAADGWVLRQQPGDDLGDNIAAAFDVSAPTVVIGTDSPDLPDALLSAAWPAPGDADVVLGPAFDGGFYLIAAVRPLPALDGVEWGTERVLSQTLRRLAIAGMATRLLPFWYDLDDVADLRRLRLHSGLAVGGLQPAPAAHTRAFLDSCGLD